MITSSGGGVSVTAKEGGGSNSIGMSLSGSGEAISTATNGGNIILIANSMAILSPVSTNLSSTFRLQPLTSGTQINLGSSSDPMGGPLSLSNSELGSIRTGTLIIGDATAGAISVSAGMTYPVYTPPTNVQLISGSDINVSGGGFNTGGGTLLLDPGSSSAAIKPTFNGTDVTASTLTLGGDLNIAINGTTAGDGGSTYSQLKVVGGVSLSGANLVLSGTTTLVGGETFVIVDNDGTEAVGGTFSNFAQGATLSNFLGSGRSATISYTGGTDNNDVVITVATPAAPNINIKGNGFTIINGDTSPRTQDGTDFGNVDIYSTDPVVRMFTIENTGTADLVIPANGITKSGAGDFGIGTVFLPLTIAPGSSATFPVIIDASGNGRRTATISIQSNDSDASPYTFDVTAVGVSPEINVTGLGQDILSGDTTPSTLDDTDFGSVDVNSGVVSHTFTIQNTGGTGGDLYINAGAITISGTHANEFSISGITLPVTVSPGQSVTFVVNFNPAAIGTRTATIRIANNDLGENQYRFDVQGTGITADYTISTTGNNLVITDVTGTGETLDISQNSSNIRFDVTGKTFSLSNGLATNFPADVPLSNLASITVNTAIGNDIINVGAFATQLPTLTINGGTGDDEVVFEGSINFASNASLDLDMQNDDANPGIDRVSFNSGNVILSGTGTATLKVSKSVSVVAGASVQTSDGNLTIESNQQTIPTAANFGGVEVYGTILVNGSGNLLVKGKGGNLTNTSQNGVMVSSGGLIQGGATGTTTIIGTGGASSGSFNCGVVVTRANSKITSSGGNVSVTGQGGGRATAAENDGILVFDGSQISAGGTGTVTVIGTGGQNSTGSSNFGVSVRGTNAQIFSNNGHVSVTGNGGGQTSGSSISNDGIVLATTTKIMAGGSGNLSITGTGGSTSGNGNDGVVLSGELSTTGGNITILANGNATPGSTGGTHTGMSILTGGLVNAGGTGTISLTGNGGSSAGSNNLGIYMTGGAVSTSNGNIHLIANGKGTEGNNKGLDIISGTITAGGQGNLLIEGQGSLTAINSGNMGVEISGTNSTVATNNGTITITGLGGGSDEQGSNIGIYVHNSGKINAGGSGNVILNGSGGTSNGESNVGVNVGNNGVINTQGGNITITGIEGNGTFNYGINLQPGATISTASNGGNIRFNTNSFYAGEDEVSNKTISTNASGTITIQPRTSNTAINLGEITDPTTAGSSLNLNDFELDYMTTGTLIIGDAMSGNITVSQPITRPASTNVQLISGGDVIISGGSMNTNGGTLLLDPGTSPKAVKPTFNGTDVIASTLSFNSDLEITINGTTLGNGTGSTYSQLNVEGAINLTGVDLLLAGTYMPIGGEIFTIVNNDGTDAITGTFNGLAEGATMPNFRGSNLSATISYTGGTGNNDVVITVGQICPTVSNAGTDQTPTCGTTQVTLAGNTPSVGTGVWSVVSGTGGTFGNANSATSTFTGVAGNSYVLRWTISNGQCSASTDDVDVTFTQNLVPPTIGTITQPTCTLPTGSVVLNGLPSSGTWILTRNPGSVTSMGTGVTTTVSGLVSGTYTFTVTNASGCTSGVSGDVDIALPPSNISITTGASLPICAGATSFTIPYTATTGSPISYSITGTGITSVTNGLLTSTPIVVNLSGPATGSSITYSLVVSNASGCVSPNVTGSVAVVGPPTISLTTLQQTLNEGNNPVLCDTDANSVNGLQFGVSSSCVSGSPVWRVQVGSGAWSNWSATAPVSQPSNNQPHRYQAACDANCASTYSGVIELTINNRASVPQNVSLMVDGVTVAVGETKEVCSLVNMPLTFNANCSTGEVVLYSVDGGEYSAGVPVGLVDNQFHNYRVRCRKSDGTPSCVESESGVMRLKLVTIPSAPTVSLSSTSSCNASASFSGQSTCGSLRTVWYNATTNVALPSLPSTVPSQTTSYYARCQTENGCVSEKSNVVTFTLTPTQVAPVIRASQEIVCTGTTVTISANCPAGSQTFWNTGVTEPSFEVAFNNVTKQTYWAKCLFEGGCQSTESARKDVYWNAFVVTLINIGESKSAVKPANDKSLWTSQFITRDGGPELEQSTQVNPTLYYVENANKLAPRYWTVNVEACGLSTDGSLTFDMLATPEMGVIRSFNTHENNAPYFMYANRDGWTELYAQNHPAYGFYQDNGSGGNVYDVGLPKGLYKLGIRYWDQKGWGSIYPSTRKPQGNVLAYQEYWFRIQSRDGVGVGAARSAESEEANGKWQGAKSKGQRAMGNGSDNGKQITDNGVFATVLPNPVSNILRLKVQNSKGQVVQTTLTDASGREVLRRQFVPETNTHQEEFGVSELPTGMYFLKVTTETQQATLKVVKAP